MVWPCDQNTSRKVVLFLHAKESGTENDQEPGDVINSSTCLGRALMSSVLNHQRLMKTVRGLEICCWTAALANLTKERRPGK